MTRRKFDIRRVDEALKRMEELTRRDGLLYTQFHWAKAMSDPAPSGAQMGHRRASEPSSATEGAALDRRRGRMVQALLDAEALLEQAFGTLEHATGGRQTIARGGRKGSFLTESEAKESHDMQSKRQSQGGGYGES